MTKHTQGDVLLVHVNGDSTPNAVTVARDAQPGVVHTEGEATGQTHAVSDDAATLCAVGDASLLNRVRPGLTV